MEPGLRAGDIVLSRRVDPASLRAGDVIRFQNGGVPVVHRIKAVQQTSRGMVFITQGDSNDFEDAPVPASAVQGKVVLRVPGLGLVPTRVRAWLGR
jgi:signal peptidase I